jgi:hypothetical protein
MTLIKEAKIANRNKELKLFLQLDDFSGSVSFRELAFVDSGLFLV